MSETDGTRPYALTARALLQAAARPPGDLRDDIFIWWADLADATGPALLPFLSRPECYSRAPLEELGLAPTPLESLSPRKGEMWALFCFRDGELTKALSTSPLRADGFALILEWRKGSKDSQLISSALHVLAVQVRRQLDADGWGLHPAFARYGDLVDFTDAELFSDAEHVGNVASAWGALAAGLRCAATGRYPSEWPFPSVQWDETSGGATGVAGLAQKMSVAADCGATVLTVARTQRREASGLLADLRAGPDGVRFRHLRLHVLPGLREPKSTADEIAMGFANARRLRRRIVMAILSPLTALLTLWGVYYWDTHRVFSKYHAAVVCHYGLPQGLYEVSTEARRNRGLSFRFDYEGVHDGKSIHHPWQLKTVWGKARKLVRVTHVNARNVPVPLTNEGYGQMPMIQEFKYADDGRLSTVLCRKRGGDDYCSGVVEKQLVYDNYGSTVNGHVALRSGDGKEYYYGDASLSQADPMLPQDGKNEIIEYVLARDDAGRVMRKEFRNRLEAICDGDGVGGMAFEYNDDGLVAHCTNLDVGGTNRVSNQWGVVCTSFFWDGPLLTNVVSRDAASRMVGDRIGVMQWAYRYDVHGNMTSAVSLDAAGRPAYNQPSAEWPNRFAECRFEWTDGLMRSRMYLGVPGHEADVWMKDGNMPGMAWERTPLGDVCAETFLDVAGHRTTNAYGICTSRLAVDDRTGVVLHGAAYGLDGRTPVADAADAVFAYSNVLDRAGNRLFTYYFSDSGSLATNRFGTAVVCSEYDGAGRVTYQLHLDADGKPRRTGPFAALETSRQRGREVEYRYCAGDAARTTTTNRAGVARVTMQYDEYGRLVRRVFLALPGTGNSIRAERACPACARWELTYDGRGNPSSVRHYDAAGHLLLLRGRPYAYLLSEYDCRGRRTSVSYYDADEKILPVENVVRVVKVVPGGAAERAGILPGDVICACDGYRLHRGTSLEEFMPLAKLAAQKPSKRLAVARMTDSGYQLLSFVLAGQSFGIYFADWKIPAEDFRRLLSDRAD